MKITQKIFVLHLFDLLLARLITISCYWEQKVIIFVDILLEKTAHVHWGYCTRKSEKA